jgi:hypothetical protein
MIGCYLYMHVIGPTFILLCCHFFSKSSWQGTVLNYGNAPNIILQILVNMC